MSSSCPHAHQHLPIFVDAFLSRNLHGYLPYALLQLFALLPAEIMAQLALAQEIEVTSGATLGTAESSGSTQESGGGMMGPPGPNGAIMQDPHRQRVLASTSRCCVLAVSGGHSHSNGQPDHAGQHGGACNTRGVRRSDPDAYNPNCPGADYPRIGQGRGFSIVAVPPGCEADSPNEDEDIFDSAGSSSPPPAGLVAN